MKNKRLNRNHSRFFLIEIDSLILKFTWKCKDRIVKTTLGKKWLEVLYYLYFKTMKLKQKKEKQEAYKSYSVQDSVVLV